MYLFSRPMHHDEIRYPLIARMLKTRMEKAEGYSRMRDSR